ncbi:HAD hydrolase-like protein [Agrobacterium tumefaciens]|uniref:HAD hydrolase-like protein n=1 Tax=Agrobacterium TaxID=357 RepID=UPI00098FC3EA|nr:HAD hydrolase-like protein [Agrobacterium tumefaciens]NSZ36428.1 HAD hydrolase-like protein [Agrobacterium tumefaciens]NTB05196.1 HAD hydrolase-like protein [Agrobacterium tumefaciens]NTB24222.1 HAD hydrolase-like protein [Agrobacterium tumefaciens]NTB31277.1 HAD hydrolase-like protein [Agrobacterium tumefaciens]
MGRRLYHPQVQKLGAVQRRQHGGRLGDRLEHDIAGASGAGLASCLVRTGILAEHPDAELDGIAAGYDIRPNFLMDRFVV